MNDTQIIDEIQRGIAETLDLCRRAKRKAERDVVVYSDIIEFLNDALIGTNIKNKDEIISALTRARLKLTEDV